MSQSKTRDKINFLTHISLKKKVNVVGLLIISFFSLILFLKVLPLLEKGKLEERRGKLKAVVNSVTSMVDFYEKEVRSNTPNIVPTMPKTIIEAKKEVIRNLRQMRYDKTEYFFILDGNGNVVMHPLKPELEGKNIMDFKDPSGKFIFKDMVLGAQKDGETFVSYIWQAKYSPIIFEPQTAYSKYYWPWDWVICSSVYTQDILDSMVEIRYLSGTYIAVTSVLTIVLLFMFVFFSLTRPLSELLKGIAELRKGNLDYQVKIISHDELGDISEEFNEMTSHRKKIQLELEDLNASLEKKVEQRTHELWQTLSEVQALKVQQDGDYYLTSLLLNPLGTNLNAHKNVKISTLLKQKKTFKFKKYDLELGGDICVSRNIVLNSKEYSVFFNADAMGKSIQGAGGVIVLGSVFESIIKRYSSDPNNPGIYPEKWMRECFVEVHKVFESFDGSMLVSVLFCLLDPETGVLYYLNSEHPHLVLYRNEKATFLIPKNYYQKLGSPISNKRIQIESFQCLSNDILILGSDGRDDILIENSDGTKSMNEDENLFLKRVEEAKGDLNGILEGLKNFGTLTDDLSLMSVSYKNPYSTNYTPLDADFIHQSISKINDYIANNQLKIATEYIKELLKEYSYEPSFLKAQVVVLAKSKNYYEAASLAEEFFEKNPMVIEFGFLASFCYKKANKLEKAIEFGERVRLRDFQMIKNLINLVDSYHRKGNKERATKIFLEALALDPKDHQVEKWKEMLRI